MNTNDAKTFIPFADQLANAAGEITRKYYRKPLLHEVKADTSPVTVADREIERALRAMIRQEFPEHGIIGEEFEAVEATNGCEYRWIIDPIDGTKSFMIGRPIFATMVALLRQDTPVLGLIDQPILSERWIGVEHYATNMNYEQIETRNCHSLDHAVLCTTSPNLFGPQDYPAFDAIRKASKYVVYGGDCYSYGLLARGSVDIVVEADLKPYDFCALKPIIEGAKGIITDWEGQPLSAKSDGRVLACGDPALHAQALAHIRQCT